MNIFYRKFAECKECDTKQAVKRYYDNKDELLQQQDIKVYALKSQLQPMLNQTTD